MILPEIRDKRFITLRRGGTLLDPDHHLLAIWAADCALRALHYFEEAFPSNPRPRRAIECACAWANGAISVRQALDAAGGAQSAAREAGRALAAARFAALSAGQAAATAHVAAHQLGAAAYAIRSVMAACPADKADAFRHQECLCQRAMLPARIRPLVLDDQRRRNDICWRVFS